MATGLGDLKKRPIPRPVRADGGAVKIKHEIIPPHRVPDAGLAESNFTEDLVNQVQSSTAPKASNLPITGVQEPPSNGIGNFSLDYLNASEQPDNNPTTTRQYATTEPDNEKNETQQQLDKKESGLNGLNAKISNNSDNNSTTTRQYTTAKPDNKKNETRQQLDKQENTLSGYVDKKEDSHCKPDSNPTTTQGTTRQRTRQEPDKKFEKSYSPEDTILQLPENPRKAFTHFCDELLENAGEYVLTTYSLLAAKTGIPEGSIRTVLKDQLRAKYKLIALQADGGGRQAKIKVFISQETLRIYFKLRNRFPSTRQQLDKELDKQPDKIASNELIYLKKEELNTHVEFFDGYEEIDWKPLTKLKHPIFQKQILDVRKNLIAENRNKSEVEKIIFTAQQMREFTEKFVQYASIPTNISNIRDAYHMQGTFVKMAMDVAKSKGAYDPFGHILSEADKATISITKKREEELKRKQQVDNELCRVEFEHWKFDLSADQRRAILKNLEHMNLDIDTINGQLLLHYQTFVWPEIREQFRDKIAEELLKIEKNEMTQAQAALTQKAQELLHSPKWVNQMTREFDLLKDPENAKSKLLEIAKKAVEQERGRG